MFPFSLAVIEDTEDIRTGLHDYFSNQPEVESILTFGSMEAFFETVESGYMPDIVLSDIGLPGMDGIEGIRRTSEVLPGADVIMFTVFKDGERIFNALCAGATGYILKGTPMPEIKNAMLEIRKGGSYMTPSIARKVVEHFKIPAKKNDAQLTDKEKEVISGLLDGLSYKLIADKLFISIDTVRFRIKSIYKKLHVNSKAEVLAKALKGEI